MQPDGTFAFKMQDLVADINGSIWSILNGNISITDYYNNQVRKLTLQ
jgi:hypothetical protein